MIEGLRRELETCRATQEGAERKNGHLKEKLKVAEGKGRELGHAVRGKAEPGAKRRVDNVRAGNVSRSCSYFSIRYASSLTNATILTTHPNPFHDSLRSSQKALTLGKGNRGGQKLPWTV